MHVYAQNTNLLRSKETCVFLKHWEIRRVEYITEQNLHFPKSLAGYTIRPLGSSILVLFSCVNYIIINYIFMIMNDMCFCKMILYIHTKYYYTNLNVMGEGMFCNININCDEQDFSLQTRFHCVHILCFFFLGCQQGPIETSWENNMYKKIILTFFSSSSSFLASLPCQRVCARG